MEKEIIIQGARENNLKNINIKIPRDKLVVFTGLSGSGKSSLAFDTIYAEGQKKYVESLSAYARQFLGLMKKPDVSHIDGLSPAISIDQKTTNRNPRSTVGTVTEIYDYLRLLFARVGIPHCPICQRPITNQSVDYIIDKVQRENQGKKIIILAPIVRGRKGEHKGIFQRLQKDGYTRVRVDSDVIRLDEGEINLEKNYKHNIELVIDRIAVKDGGRDRLAEAIETGVDEGEGTVIISFAGKEKKEEIYSTKLACPVHGVGITEMEPRSFSFNSPFGACDECSGLGYKLRISEESIIKDKGTSILEGALGSVFSTMDAMGFYRQMLNQLAKEHNADLNKPYNKLPKNFKEDLLYGTKGRHLKYKYTSKAGRVSYMDHSFEGIIPSLERRFHETDSEHIREKIGRMMTADTCPKCKGRRLKDEVLAVKIADKNIIELTDLSVDDAIIFFENLEFTKREKEISKMVIKEIKERLGFLKTVGLGYLTLSRNAGTLSGGESQRIRLATQIGSGLVGVLYILDEPSIGLHQRDNRKLLTALRNLTDMGNSLIVVEHDEETMEEADHIVDIGPGAGINGGKLVCQGSIEDIKKCKDSITGQFLSGKRKIEIPKIRRHGNGKSIKVIGAKENNLKNINVKFPLGKLVLVTGVSGSGKSTLVNQILYKSMSNILNGKEKNLCGCKKIEGASYCDKIIDIDQSPIGRTPRSNPATYTGMFDLIRDLFAELPEAKIRGFKKGRFSFNVKGGRCEACKGDGITKVSMNFLPDVYVPCDICNGARYNKETLEVKYKGKNIADVLDMTVAEALEFFKNQNRIRKYLKTLDEVGLSYIKLGQPSTELSGGEAQRVKLATELSKRNTGNTLYILDEPTTGLHFADVEKLMYVLQRLVDEGNTVVVIEHNLDVIKCADWIIDLGPEGGDNGGTIVACGTPEEIAKCESSYTGYYIKKILERGI